MPSSSKKANEQFQNGNKKFDSCNYKDAVTFYGNALETDPKFIEAAIARSYAYLKLHRLY